MSRNIVAVDIDDTIHEFSNTVALVALNEFGYRVDKTPNEWRYGLAPITDQSVMNEIFARCHDREYIFLTKPYPWASQSLREIEKDGYEIQYFTDRKASAHDDTRDWLKKYDFPTPDNLHCCEDKRRQLKRYSDNLVTVIDDRPRTLIFSRYELGLPHVFSIQHDINRNLTDIPGIHLFHTWAEIHDQFTRLITNGEA